VGTLFVFASKKGSRMLIRTDIFGMFLSEKIRRLGFVFTVRQAGNLQPEASRG